MLRADWPRPRANDAFCAQTREGILSTRSIAIISANLTCFPCFLRAETVFNKLSSFLSKFREKNILGSIKIFIYTGGLFLGKDLILKKGNVFFFDTKLRFALLALFRYENIESKRSEANERISKKREAKLRVELQDNFIFT